MPRLAWSALATACGAAGRRWVRPCAPTTPMVSGRAGNVGAGAIKNRAQPASSPLVVTNPVRTWGGADSETVAEGEKQIARTLQHRDRLVSAEDFATITRRTPGVDIGRVEVLPAYHPELSSELGDAAGAVTLMLLPAFDPHASGRAPARPGVPEHDLRLSRPAPAGDHRGFSAWTGLPADLAVGRHHGSSGSQHRPGTRGRPASIGEFPLPLHLAAPQAHHRPRADGRRKPGRRCGDGQPTAHGQRQRCADQPRSGWIGCSCRKSWASRLVSARPRLWTSYADKGHRQPPTRGVLSRFP